MREGIIGIPRFINPLLVVSDADKDLTNLIYTGLLRHNGQGILVPSLAENYEISEDGLIYTFHLKKDAAWNDGAPLTAEDVVFTITLLKDPQYRSVIRPNWEGVTVSKPDEYTVVFTLAKPYAPFLENTTLGILPKHVWKDTVAAEFTLSEKNLKPVGAGPYRVVLFTQNQTGRITSFRLEPNPHYLPHPPYISQLEFFFFTSGAELEQSWVNAAIDAVSISALPSKIENYFSLSLPLPRIFGVFFNQNSSKILADTDMRRALTYATDKDRLVREVLANNGIVSNNPLPFDKIERTAEPDDQQELYQFDMAHASLILDDAGWKDINNDGIREKEIDNESVRLSFTISTSDTPDLVNTARLLQQMWWELGAEVQLSIFEIGDFEQNVLRPRNYEAILFGEVFGYDPDPFPFWHASQRNDPGLNIALYTNPPVDSLVSQARTTIDKTARHTMYRDFEKIVNEEYPAIFLYSPNYRYLPANDVKGAMITNIVLPSDRFGNIHEWYIKTKKRWKGF